MSAMRTSPWISAYATGLACLTIGGLLPYESVKYGSIALWTFSAMPTSALLAAPFTAVSVAMADSGANENSVLFVLAGLAFHVTVDVVNVAGLIGAKQALRRCRLTRTV
jgi:hypothetical protein